MSLNALSIVLSLQAKICLVRLGINKLKSFINCAIQSFVTESKSMSPVNSKMHSNQRLFYNYFFHLFLSRGQKLSHKIVRKNFIAAVKFQMTFNILILSFLNRQRAGETDCQDSFIKNCSFQCSSHHTLLRCILGAISPSHCRRYARFMTQAPLNWKIIHFLFKKFKPFILPAFISQHFNQGFWNKNDIFYSTKYFCSDTDSKIETANNLFFTP